MGPSGPSMALVGALFPSGEFEWLLSCCGPVPHANPSALVAFRFISSTVRWLSPSVLVFASCRFLPSKLTDFSLFNCGGTASRGTWLLAIKGMDAHFGVSPASCAGTVLPLPGVARQENRSGGRESNRLCSRHIVCADAVELASLLVGALTCRAMNRHSGGKVG